MKLVTVQFADSVDIAVLKGKTGITVGDSAVSATGGTVFALSDVIDPPAQTPVLIPHTHVVTGSIAAISVTGTTAPGVVTGNSGPAVAT